MPPHRRQPTRLPLPWDSPGKSTGVDCHFLLQCMKVKSESEVIQSCPVLRDPMDCSLPGSSVHGIFQARVLEWGAIAFSDTKYEYSPYLISWLMTWRLFLGFCHLNWGPCSFFDWCNPLSCRFNTFMQPSISLYTLHSFTIYSTCIEYLWDASTVLHAQNEKISKTKFLHLRNSRNNRFFHDSREGKRHSRGLLRVKRSST